MSDPHAENKRLHRLDEAAVGKEKAIKRWQIQVGNHWENLNHRPTWFAIFSYRRDPDAPPLPSLDWHEAPDWANWRGIDFDDFGPAWHRKEPPDGGWDFIEPRPNPEWFDLTYPDYEAWNHVMDEQQSNEYLTGPELMYAIGDAMAAGEGPEVFEHFSNVQKCWVTASNWTFLVGSDSDGNKIRRKPRMRHLTDMHGQRWEFPEPIREIVPNDRYFVSLEIPRKNGIRHFGDLPTQIEINLVREGRCFSTRESRDQAERALIAASGGSCE